MENMNLFKKYQSKMITEAAIKAAVCGLAAGFAVNFVTAFISWLCEFSAGLWLSIGLGLGAAVICAVVMYFVKFRPTAQEVARRVDALGLQERMVTMLEFAEDDSYIARRQREDAAAHAATTGAGLLKIHVSKALVGVACASAVCGVAMTTLHGLALGGVIPGFGDIVNPGEEFLTVQYVAEEGGFIDGNENQLILYGETAESVMAVADDGYVFVGWDDGVDEPFREDPDITDHYLITALFEKIEGEGNGGGDGEGDVPGEGNGEPTDKPGEDNGNGEGGEGNEDGSDGNGGGEGEGGSENGEPSDGGQGPGAGGQYKPGNQVIDGETYYRDIFEQYYQQGMEYITGNNDLTPEEKEAIEKFLNGLK